MQSVTRFARQVSDVHVQGASAVARATLHELAHLAGWYPYAPSTREFSALKRAGQHLAAVRPTEPMARNLVAWFLYELTRSQPRHLVWLDKVARIEHELRYQLTEIDARIAASGASLVKSKQTIFTHCHSSLAEHILVEAYAAHKWFQVYHTETRPLFQGHLTDINLRRAHIPTTMVADSAAAYLISNHSGDEVKVDWVLLGADSIGRDGSVINKIGSFGIALAAHDSGIPVYVAASLLKVDWRGETKIELRPGSELWAHAPKGTQIVNYAFDRVPPEYISGLITEAGILQPSRVSVEARRAYPWLLRRS